MFGCLLDCWYDGGLLLLIVLLCCTLVFVIGFAIIFGMFRVVMFDYLRFGCCYCVMA